MTDIQNTIKNYLNDKGEYSVFTERCFIGMLETGEATIDDFMAVGGIILAGAVAKAFQRHNENLAK